MIFAPATLRKRLAWSIGLLVAPSLVIAGVALWALSRMQADYGVAIRGYAQLRDAYEVGLHVARARELLNGGEDSQAVRELVMADAKLGTGRDLSRVKGWPAESSMIASELDAELRRALDARDLADRSEATQSALGKLSALATSIRATVQRSQASAARARTVALRWLVAVAGLSIAAAMVIGVRQYRLVTRPLGALAEQVRAFARGKLDARVALDADEEFQSLGRDFNQMADELGKLYQQMEQQVADRTAELVRSERLASVGFLAAGVAHEINNPLGIIAAYGERCVQQLGRELDDQTVERVRRGLAIICEEAFRGREITARLLELARPGGGKRDAVSLVELARQMTTLMGGLPQCAGVRFKVEHAPGDMMRVLANEGEIKQVILNLLFNSVEAMEPGRAGEVRLSVTRTQSRDVRLSVSDNGRGMDRETLARAFEPFFSAGGERRADAEDQSARGARGLGLSVCHAIVQSHGGSIRADSDGPGCGSQLTMTLPQSKEAEVVDARG